MNLKRILALAMSVLMLAVSCAGAFAESAPETTPGGVQLQGVDISGNSASQLSAEETEEYNQIADSLKNGEESVTVGDTTYTLSSSDGEQTVLTGVTRSGDSALGVTGVEQVTLTEGEGAVTPSEPTLPEVVIGEVGEVTEIYEEKYESEGGQTLTMMDLYAGLGRLLSCVLGLLCTCTAFPASSSLCK